MGKRTLFLFLVAIFIGRNVTTSNASTLACVRFEGSTKIIFINVNFQWRLCSITLK